MFRRFLASIGAAAAISASVAIVPAPAAAGGPAASEWTIGPIIRGRNYSPNMPLHPERGAHGPTFTIPATGGDAHVHYVTAPVSTLAGARSMRLRYRIDAERGTRFVAQEHPTETATLSLYFQRRGDTWTARSPTHRWYSPHSRVMPLTPGVHEVVIGFDEPWIAMMGGDARSLPRAYAAALEQASSVGFVFGSASGRGHGVYASSPARFTVLDFAIE